MELDSGWADVGTPVFNVRDSSAHSGLWSRHFLVNAANEGIRSDTFTTETGAHKIIFWFWCASNSGVYLRVGKGDGIGYALDIQFGGWPTGQWNEIEYWFDQPVAGSSAYVQLYSGHYTSGDWYIDDVQLKYCGEPSSSSSESSSSSSSESSSSSSSSEISSSSSSSESSSSSSSESSSSSSSESSSSSSSSESSSSSSSESSSSSSSSESSSSSSVSSSSSESSSSSSTESSSSSDSSSSSSESSLSSSSSSDSSSSCLPENAVYTRQTLSELPSGNADLAIPFTCDDYWYIEVIDGNTVEQTASGDYTIFQFKDKHVGLDLINMTCATKSGLAPTTSTVHLEIFNDTSATWESLISNNTAGANEIFTLHYIMDTDLGDYYDAQDWVTCRVYQRMRYI
jgi:hypothetical protein